jgi:X-Pro dipeptidyl-peptidase
MRRKLLSRWGTGRAIVVALCAMVVAGLAVATGGTATAATSPFRIANGVSQPIYSYDNAIRETVWVDVGTDLDNDGTTDRVAVDIIRPAEPAANGQRIPVIMDQSPYYQCCGRGNENQKKAYAPDGTPTDFPMFYDNYFVPRGYAVALVDDPGTSRSTGCDVGNAEVNAGVAVINWLNGKGEGFTGPFDDARKYANWSNGSVGMIGKSNDGLIAMGVAATGVPGLKTAIPIEGTSNLYDYWAPGGALTDEATPDALPYEDNDRAAVLCHAAEVADDTNVNDHDGNFTPYWKQFDFNLTANRIKASVFTLQGFNDDVVSPLQFGEWWQGLTANHVQRKAWLSQAGHADPFDLRRADWVDTLHRWLDRYLLDVPNGIDHEPMISIEHTPGVWTSENQWPPPGVRPEVLHPDTGTTTGLGTLTAAHGSGGTEPVQDTTDLDSDRFAWAADPDTASSERVLFTTAPFTKDTRIAGTPSLTVSVRSSKPVANVSAELVDYGPATVRNAGGPLATTGYVNLTTRSCWGESSATDSACYLDTKADLIDVDQQIVSDGWTDVGHYANPYRQLPLSPNRFYTRQLPLSTLDHIVPAGHRLALVVGGTDNWQFFIPSQAPQLTFNLAGTSVTIPVVAGGKG